MIGSLSFARLLSAAAAAGLVAAVVSPPAAATASTPAGVVMAVTGRTTDDGYWRGPGTMRWTNGGGSLQSGLAVAQVGDITHVIGTDRDGGLVHRTDTSGWRPLADRRSTCAKPTAVAAREKVHVACVGGDSRAYAATFDGTSRKPYVNSFTNLGGRVESVAVAADEDGPVWFATGGQYRIHSTGAQGNTYIRFAGVKWQPWDARCTGPVGAAISVKRATVACQDGNHVRVEIFMPNNDKTLMHKVPGRTVGAIGVVPTGDGSSAQLLAQGLDGVPRSQRIDDRGGSGRWTSMNGASRGGVAGSSVVDLTPAGTGAAARDVTDR